MLLISICMCNILYIVLLFDDNFDNDTYFFLCVVFLFFSAISISSVLLERYWYWASSTCHRTGSTSSFNLETMFNTIFCNPFASELLRIIQCGPILVILAVRCRRNRNRIRCRRTRNWIRTPVDGNAKINTCV